MIVVDMDCSSLFSLVSIKIVLVLLLNFGHAIITTVNEHNINNDNFDSNKGILQGPWILIDILLESFQHRVSKQCINYFFGKSDFHTIHSKLYRPAIKITNSPSDVSVKNRKNSDLLKFFWKYIISNFDKFFLFLFIVIDVCRNVDTYLQNAQCVDMTHPNTRSHYN